MGKNVKNKLINIMLDLGIVGIIIFLGWVIYGIIHMEPMGEKENRIDEEITYEETVTTPRNLFGASEETVKCAGDIEASGEYRFGNSHENDDSTVSESCEGRLKYARARDESGNTSSCLSGNVKIENGFRGGIGVGNSHKENGTAGYKYYKQNIEGKSEDCFLYYGTSGLCDSIDIDRIIMPDSSQFFVENIYVIDKRIRVVVSDGIQPIIDGFGDGVWGKELISKVIYDFDANTHELKEVCIRGEYIENNSRNKKDYSAFNDNTYYLSKSIEAASFELTLYIRHFEKTPAEMIQMPETCTQNGNINDLILYDKEFDYCPTIDSPFDIKSESLETTQEIWADFTEGIEKSSCSIKEMNNALKEIAPKYGCDEVNNSYAFLGCDYFSDLAWWGIMFYGGGLKYHKTQSNYAYDEIVLVKNEFLSEGNVKYVIIVPIFFDGNKAQSKVGIAIDGKDYAKVGYNGIAEYDHENSAECRSHAVYKFYGSGTVEKKYEETKVDKISDLSNDSNLAFYPETDRDVLKSMADGLDIAAVSGISRIDISESDSTKARAHKYYVIEYDLGKTRVGEINEEYSLEIVTVNERDSILRDNKIGTIEQEVSWVQFSEGE